MVVFSCFVFSLIACLPFFSDHLSKGTQLFVEWLLRKVYLRVMGEKFHKTKKAFPAQASWLAILHQALKKKKKYMNIFATVLIFLFLISLMLII